MLRKVPKYKEVPVPPITPWLLRRGSMRTNSAEPLLIGLLGLPHGEKSIEYKLSIMRLAVLISLPMLLGGPFGIIGGRWGGQPGPMTWGPHQIHQIPVKKLVTKRRPWNISQNI